MNFLESIASQFLLFFDRSEADLGGWLSNNIFNLLESMASQFFHFAGRLKQLVVQSIKTVEMILSRSRAMATPFVT